MSIISTIYLPEGIIMSADSRLTGTTRYSDGSVVLQTLSDNAQKLFLIKEKNIGISWCGDAYISGRSVGDFLRQFEIEVISDEDNILTIPEKLKNYTIEKDGGNISYQLSGYLNDVPYVYSIFNDRTIVRSNIEIDNSIRYGFCWNGECEALNKLVLAEPKMLFNFDLMQLKDGIDLAEFLIDLTIKYQRFDTRLATCGGEIDILVITKDYAKWVKHKILNP